MRGSELHEQISREATRVAEAELERRAAAIDEGRAPVELGALGALGLLAPDLPEDAGGAGADALARVLVTEALAASCASTALAAALQGLAARLVHRAGEAALARAFASGETTAALALWEGEAGDDTFERQGARLASGRVTGRKHVLGPARPGALLVLARGERGRAITLVPADAPGVVFHDEPASAGLRGLPRRTVLLDAEARVLGDEGLAQAVRDGARAVLAPVAAGLAARALDESRRFAMMRRQFGRSIARFQGVQFLVAGILVARDGCRALGRSAALAEERGELSPALAAAAALEAPAVAVRAALDAVQVHGGTGYTREVVVERLLRDAFALASLAGAAGEGAELTLAERALSLPPSPRPST